MSAASFIPYLPLSAAAFPYSSDLSDALVTRSPSPLNIVVDAENGTNTQGHIRWVNGGETSYLTCRQMHV
jgi:hypothetical protein